MTETERRLEADLVTATRGKLSELTVLRSLKSALHNERIAKKSATGITDEEAMAVFRRELKKRYEAAQLYDQGGRAELAGKEKEEAVVIERYLPPPPPLAEINKVMSDIKQAQGFSGPQAIGPLTKATLAHFKGAADGQTVSQLARELLSPA